MDDNESNRESGAVESFTTRVKSWLWGYDFFISYHWASGGAYAVQLAAQLREKGYEVFLDRTDFAAGDEWRSVGETALRNTQRMVIIATRDAVFASKPVAHEVKQFATRQSHLIPIYFGDAFQAERKEPPGTFVVLDHLPEETLGINTRPETLSTGPTPDVVQVLEDTYDILRRRKLRQTITAVAMLSLMVLAIAASISAVNAWMAQQATGRALADLRIESTEKEAAAYMAGLGGPSSYPTESECKSLRLLADSNASVRLAFFQQLMTSGSQADRLRTRYPHVLHALTGLDLQTKDTIKARLIGHGSPPASDVSINIAVVEFGLLLNDHDAELEAVIARNLLAAMKKTSDPDELALLADLLNRLQMPIPGDQALEIFARVLTTVNEWTSRDKSSALGNVLRHLVKNMSTEDRVRCAPQILSAMSSANTLLSLAAFGTGLSGVGEDLRGSQALEGAGQLVAALTLEIGGEAKRANRFLAVRAICDALLNLVPFLPREEAMILAPDLLAEVQEVTDPRVLPLLRNALGNLGKDRPDELPLDLAREIVDAMERQVTANWIRVCPLGEALGRLTSKFPQDRSAEVAAHLTAAMKHVRAVRGPRGSATIAALGEALAGLGNQLPAQPGLDGARQLVTAMTLTNDDDGKVLLIGALEKLSVTIPVEDVLILVEQIVTAIENPDATGGVILAPGPGGVFSRDRPRELFALEKALRSLAKTIPAEQAWAFSQLILNGIKKTTPTSELFLLSSVLSTLAEDLSNEQALAAVRKIVIAVAGADNAEFWSIPSDALGRLGARLTREDGLVIAKRIIAISEKSTVSDKSTRIIPALSGLSSQLAGAAIVARAREITAVAENPGANFSPQLQDELISLAEQIPRDQAREFATPIVTSMKSIGDPHALSVLGKALSHVSEDLTEEAALRVAKRIVATMKEDLKPSELSSLGIALAGLGTKLPATQAVTGAEIMRKAMQPQTGMKQAVDTIGTPQLGVALGSISLYLPPVDAELSAQQILTMVENLINSYSTSNAGNANDGGLGGALGKLVEVLPAEQALPLARQILGVIEGTTSKRALAALFEALSRLIAQLPRKPASAAAQYVLATMERQADPAASSLLAADLLGVLAARLTADDTCSVLKSVVCAGDVRERVLAKLETATGQEFDGDIWAVVRWLEDNDVSVKLAPRFPSSGIR